MQCLLISVQSSVWKAQVYYYITDFFLPIIYAFALNITLLSHVVSGAEIGFSYQRCEWHNGCLCTMPWIHKHWYWTKLFFHVFCQLSVFHGSFNKHYPGWLFCAAICQSKWSACFLARRENKLALFEFGCVLCRTVPCICFIPSLVLPWAMQWKRLGMKREGVPDESKGGARKNRGRKLHSRIWNCSLRILNFNWFA